MTRNQIFFLLVLVILAGAYVASAQAPMLVAPATPGVACMDVESGFVYIFDDGILSKYAAGDLSFVCKKDLYIDPNLYVYPGAKPLKSNKKP